MFHIEDFITTDVHVLLAVGLVGLFMLIVYAMLFLYAEERYQRRHQAAVKQRLERRRQLAEHRTSARSNP